MHSESCKESCAIPGLGVMQIPALGIGTYQLRGEECVNSVREAIKMGYRLIDTAAVYRNEELVAEGILQSGIDRAKLFVIVKIAMKSMHCADAIKSGILESIRKLHINYADLVLIHWPGCGKKKPEDAEAHYSARARCWEVMCELQNEDKVRYLGVSNFLPRHFDAINSVINEMQYNNNIIINGSNSNNSNNSNNYAEVKLCNEKVTPILLDTSITKVDKDSNINIIESNNDDKVKHIDVRSECFYKPLLDQIELHPLCLQRDVVEYCEANKIVVQQYSPLGQGNSKLIEHPVLLNIAKVHFAPFSVSELLIMWGLAQGFSVLVRSRSIDHLRTNWNAALTFFNHYNDKCNVNTSKELFDNDPNECYLTLEQHDILANLHKLMNVNEDEHMCWFSSHIP